MPSYKLIPYQNPFRAVGGATVAGGANTGIMGSLQHPNQYAKADFLANRLQSMGIRRAIDPFSLRDSGFQSRMDYQDSQPKIHGYSGSGIPTNLFSQLTGRAPTAADVEAANGGGLSAPHDQMGSLSSYYAMRQMPSQWQMLQMAAGAPTTMAIPIAHRMPITPENADNIPPHSLMAADGGNIPAGQPVIVGERGPEAMVPMPRIGMGDLHFAEARNDFDRQMQAQRLKQIRRSGSLHNAKAFIRGNPSLSVDTPETMRMDDYYHHPAEYMQSALRASPVGQNGPEMVIPKTDVQVIPNEYLPTLYLMNGDILGYMKHFMR